MLVKRFFDLTLTIPGLLLLTPLFMIIAIWIKIDSPGPVFFRQVRVGQFGNHFRIYKFRTMVVDAEKTKQQLTTKGDNRITRSGRILRKYKLDEFPQLINVIKGEMSLVGPRPEVPKYVEKYPPKVREVVLSVPPGITDFASIFYRNENEVLASAQSVEDVEYVYVNNVLPVKLDYYQQYVNKQSLLLDIKIILATVKTLLK